MQNNNLINVSALISTRVNNRGITEILNVLAHNKSQYGFPGGKIEKGETPKQAIVRETIEELGVKPTNIQQIGLYSALTPEGKDITMYVFSGDLPSGIHPQAEIKELHWMTYNEMAANQSLLTPMTLQHVMPILKSL